MKKKKWLIPVCIVILIAVLWCVGIIPKQIARVSASIYVDKHFPEMQLECKKIEWGGAFGDYMITLEDKDGNVYPCLIGPALFPTSLGQGLFAIQSEYNENYSSTPPEQGGTADFSFSYKTEKTEYKAGDCFEIQVTITNTSGKDYRYTGSSSEFCPEISLYYIADGQKLGHIEHQPHPMTDDFVKHVIADGESRTSTYYFVVPQDAMCGEYSITLSYKGVAKEFVGVLNIVE